MSETSCACRFGLHPRCEIASLRAEVEHLQSCCEIDSRIDSLRVEVVASLRVEVERLRAELQQLVASLREAVNRFHSLCSYDEFSDRCESDCINTRAALKAWEAAQRK